MTEKFDELVAKLKEIFQIDKPELDFGIYKIMNAKASMIQDFLNKDLKAKVQAALADKASAGKKALEEKIAKLEAQLDAVHVPHESSLDWISAKAELDKLAASDDSESLVYAHLLTFFSRYYDDGDFISKRRYKEGQYAIPYSGEEVKLHWANADQYYTKSGENFTNYDFTIGGKRVHFKLVQAAVAKDNVKDNDAVRCFKLWDPANAEVVDDEEEREKLPDDILEEKDGELYIYFQYLKCKKGTKQADLLKDAVEKIATELGTQQLATKFNILAPAPTEKDKSRTVLDKHLQRYVAKNTSDYFIHKNLWKFLTWELDAYVKNEMMNLDDISNAATFDAVAANLRLIQTFRLVAMELIGFMAQLEDFQKKLWLKKKFVVQCDYCITMDRMKKASEALYTEAKSNSAQIAEWEKHGIADDPTQSDLTAVDARMVDTRFFDEEFKAKLLRSIPDLDEQCDGVLIHAENYGALRLIEGREKGQVKAIFIDPPYNTGEDGFPYKDKYQSSSWLSMMNDRLRLSMPFMGFRGLLACHMDEHEHTNLDMLLENLFGSNNLGPLVWDKRNPKGDAGGLAVQHEYVHFASVRNKEWLKQEEDSFVRDKPHAEGMLKKAAALIKKYKGVTEEVRNEFAEWITKSDFTNGEKAYHFIDDNGDVYQSVSMAWPNKQKAPPEYFIPLKHPVSGRDCPVPSRGWRNPPERMKELQDRGLILFGEDETTQPRRKYLLKENLTENVSSLYYMGGSDDQLFKDLGLQFENPKTVKGTSYFLKAISRPQDSLVLDYFAGSGTTAHAVIALNREDGGKRKYILVEMGEHFDTVLKPRIEKVVYSPDWKDGKPTAGTKGISHCFKYMTLESYEDTLNNLKLEKPGELGLLKNEYMLNYMLEIESRKSLLNLDKFAHPFDYTLELAVDSSGATKPQKVDMVETFNYLIGLRVGLIDRHIDKGYVLVQGDLPNGEEALVLWRDLGKIDNDALKKILDKQAIHPREKGFVLYVNGDHNIPNTVKEDGEEKTIKVRSIEADFTRLMFEEE